MVEALVTSRGHRVPWQSFLMVTQHCSLVTAVNEEKRCVTFQVTTAKGGDHQEYSKKARAENASDDGIFTVNKL